jgi:uncharacterized Fe-S cluster protein YjdI
MKREASRFNYEKSPWASGDAAQAQRIAANIAKVITAAKVHLH